MSEIPKTVDREGYNLEQREIFNQTVDLFDKPLPPEIVARLEEITRAGRIEKGQAVLDVGAGVGALTEHILAFEPGRVIACDLSPKMLARLKDLFPGVERILGDVADLSLADNCLDVVFMNAMFSNIADKPAALTNICRMLKAGGRMVVSHPEGRRFITKLKAHVPFELDDLPGQEQWAGLLAGYPLESELFVDKEALFIAVARRGEG